MSSVLEPEVQFAQKLAANEKPTRTKALKRLRKYISVRSQKETGGFTGDELLKLWKGLFYCLWMQDKPLLQEDLSNHISSLIHNFHDLDGQILYLDSFLQTMKREWTGIDRLRMDKFFQLVRFMFRQTFEMLKRKNWENSAVDRFLQLLTVQLLQHDSAAPSGLYLHVLDLYLTELAAVGSEELTADQNLMFINPFCKTAAKTKDRTLFGAICSNIFSVIIEQAPFAIEELMKEVKADEDSLDSGQASDEDCEEEIHETMSKPLHNKISQKQLNGCKSEEEEDEEDVLLHLEDSDTELPYDDDIGPVLQFDYSGLADKLLKLASRNSTPNHNRQKLYKIVKVLKDLSRGIFPRNEYPEEVSTDEDDDMFGSRRRMKKRHHMNKEEGTPGAKKRMKKETPNLTEQNKDGEQTHQNANEGKKKKKRKKKKAGLAKSQSTNEEVKNAEKGPQCSQEDFRKEAVAQSSTSSIKVTEAATSQAEAITLFSCEAKKQPSVTVSEDLKPCTSDKDQSDVFAKKKKTRDTSEPEAVTSEQQQVSATEMSTEADTKVPGKKKKKNDTTSVCHSAGNDEITKKPTDATAPANLKTDAEVKLEGKLTDASQQQPAESLKKKAKKKSKQKLDEALGASPFTDGSTAILMNNNRRGKKTESTVEEVTQVVNAERQITMATPAKKKWTPAECSVDTDISQKESEACSSSVKMTRKKKRKIPVVIEFEADEVETAVNGFEEKETLTKKTKCENDVEELSTPLSTKKSQKKVKNDFITFQSNAMAPTPLFCRTKSSSSKKKIQTPKSESKKVTFGLKNNKTAEFRKSDRSLLVSPDGSSRVPFDPEQKPKFGVLKSPPTPGSSLNKKTRPMSLRSPKVTPKRRPLAADFF